VSDTVRDTTRSASGGKKGRQEGGYTARFERLIFDVGRTDECADAAVNHESHAASITIESRVRLQ